MEKKYKTEKIGDMLRIIALKDFPDVKKGDKGGWIEKEENLSQEGNCWVYDGSVSGNAKVYGDATVSAMAMVCGNARVFGKACITGLAKVSGNAKVYGSTWVRDHAYIYGKAQVYGNAVVYGDAQVSGNAKVYGGVHVYKGAKICGNVKLHSPNITHIPFSIKNNKDYITLRNEPRVLSIFSSNNNLTSDDMFYLTMTTVTYINNIQTIRQLYGEKI